VTSVFEFLFFFLYQGFGVRGGALLKGHFFSYRWGKRERKFKGKDHREAERGLEVAEEGTDTTPGNFFSEACYIAFHLAPESRRGNYGEKEAGSGRPQLGKRTQT